MNGERLRVRGLVQGVGFRPTVWRLAQELGLCGDVRNDGEGVLIRLQAATSATLDQFCARLQAECPPLARIDAIERAPLIEPLTATCFTISASDHSAIHTGIVADAATCPACLAEIRDPHNRRYRYAFTNCTHCGPRLSIINSLPYDRAGTSMAAFPMCAQCQAEYRDPADRRFHAQPNACPACGPQLWLADASGQRLDPARWGAVDALAAASHCLAAGQIVAIKGIGSFHLVCDAGNAAAVATLRQRKQREAKPLALMARDLDVIRRWAHLSEREAACLRSPAAPIVLLQRRSEVAGLAPALAPGQATLGLMLPASPLHHLLLADWEHPLVMTSANRSDEPPCTDNAEALRRLTGIADLWLLHDRDISNRIDDSVWRDLDGAPRPLRRARGDAPAPLPLPSGFATSPPLLALGGELKNTVCLLRDGAAILSQHLGDLEDARTARAYRDTLARYAQLFEHRPTMLAVDAHPDYHSSQFGRTWAARDGLRLLTVQHHHAHLASVLADNAWPLDGGAVLGVIFDGLGWGADGTFWGGEWLLGDYRQVERVAHLRPAALLGGAQAIREPWRNLLARLEDAGGWADWCNRYRDLPIIAQYTAHPLTAPVRQLIAQGLNAPLSSSAGRLFDAVAAALGISAERLQYEGQAAIELEALAMQAAASDDTDGYPLALAQSVTPWCLDPAPLWAPLFADLQRRDTRSAIAARFHRGLIRAVIQTSTQLATRYAVKTIALSGGVWQNRLMLDGVAAGLRQAGWQVLMHGRVPANDGGLALGQACVAAATAVSGDTA